MLRSDRKQVTFQVNRKTRINSKLRSFAPPPPNFTLFAKIKNIEPQHKIPRDAVSQHPISVEILIDIMSFD